MDKLNKDLIIFLCSYISQKDLNIVRQCTKYCSVMIGYIYFKDYKIDINILTKNNKHLFRTFVHKYSLSCNFENIKTLAQLSYIRTYNNIKSISFYRTFNNSFYKYILPTSLQELIIAHTKLKDQTINVNTFPKNLKKLSIISSYNFFKSSHHFKFLPESLELLSVFDFSNYNINRPQE
jgi:uncharacterized protein YozE (UPF0346 family)